MFTVEQRNALEFRPAGPRFQLLFGETGLDEPEASAPVARRLFIRTPAVVGDIFGWGVIHALHARVRPLRTTIDLRLRIHIILIGLIDVRVFQAKRLELESQ